MESRWLYDALKLGSSNLPNIDSFHDIDPLIVENAIPAETNLDTVCKLDQEKLDSYGTQKETNGDDEDALIIR